MTKLRGNITIETGKDKIFLRQNRKKFGEVVGTFCVLAKRDDHALLLTPKWGPSRTIIWSLEKPAKPQKRLTGCTAGDLLLFWWLYQNFNLSDHPEWVERRRLEQLRLGQVELTQEELDQIFGFSG